MQQKYTLFSCVIGVLTAFCVSLSTAQNAPVTTLATVGNAVPGQVTVPVTVVNFNNIGAISLDMDYTYAELHFIQEVPHPQLATFSIGETDLGNGKHRISMEWYGTGLSLPGGSTIMTLYFTYISGNTHLEWYDNGPSCEYADGNYNVLNDIPANSYYINGYVCGGIGNPGSITGSATVCRGQSGVAYSIAPLANVTGYIWTVPIGVIIVNGSNTNSIIVDFLNTAVSGMITVSGTNPCGSGSVSQLPVTVNELPVANAGNDTTITYGTSTILHAANGGIGMFSYHWAPETLLVNPNVQNPQTLNLFNTTLFTLLVTNQSSICQSSDEIVVTISGGLLSVNPVADPGTLCRGETSQVYANAGGGSGNYSYTWTCTPPGNPPWNSNLANPMVTPDSSKIYHLSVYDGFNTTTGDVQVTVFQLPSAVISGGDTLCGEGVTTILTIDLTGTPPWSFIYTNGLTTYTLNDQYITPYLIITSLPGIYTVLSLSDAHCSGLTYGMAVVAVFIVPETPVLSLTGSDIVSTSCCGNQWYQDGLPIPGAIGQSYTPAQTAHYFDIVTLDGCSSDTSNDIYFVMVGFFDQAGSNFTIEPNPATRYVNIKANGIFSQSLKIRLLSLSGILLTEAVFNSYSPGTVYRIDINGFSPGLYILEICTNNGSEIKKLIVF